MQFFGLGSSTGKLSPSVRVSAVSRVRPHRTYSPYSRTVASSRLLLLLLPLMLPLQHCLFLPWSYEEVTRQVGWVWTVVWGLKAVRALLICSICMHACRS